MFTLTAKKKKVSQYKIGVKHVVPVLARRETLAQNTTSKSYVLDKSFLSNSFSINISQVIQQKQTPFAGVAFDTFFVMLHNYITAMY